MRPDGNKFITVSTGWIESLLSDQRLVIDELRKIHTAIVELLTAEIVQQRSRADAAEARLRDIEAGRADA